MSTAASAVSHDIWNTVVGPSVQIPAINSYVYYFPQGHLESSSSGFDYNYVGFPSIQCQVLSLCFASTSSSDESFAKILLLSLRSAELQYANENDKNANNQTDIVVCSKILTSSDVNDGEFFVPKYCIDAIFPKLNLSQDHPMQNLSIRDAHINVWEFCHTYRGVPRCHLLTTGWSKFVNDKRLVAGDSIVFMKRKLRDELFIGIRRKARFGGNETQRIQAVVAAIESAKKGLAFQVYYYPMFGFPDFVVSATRVERSMRIDWCSEMRVRMRIPSDDSRRPAWFEGRIESADMQLPPSPWRMLKVNWDEAETHPNMKKVSPWELECSSSSSHHLSELPPCKKPKLSQNPPDILPGNHGGLNSDALFNYPPFPRAVERDDSHHQSFTGLLMREMGKESETVSTELSIGSSNYECSSTNVQQGQNSSTGDGRRCIMLFGKMIQTEEKPTEGSGLRNDGGYLRDVHEPNSSSGFRNNCKGKNIVYE